MGRVKKEGLVRGMVIGWDRRRMEERRRRKIRQGKKWEQWKNKISQELKKLGG